MNMFDMNSVSKKTLEKNKRLEKQAQAFLKESDEKSKALKEEQEKKANEAALSGARFGYASSIERSNNRVKALQEELNYTNNASTIAMTEMLSQVVENSLLLDEGEFAKLNPNYKKEIRETARGLLENAPIEETRNPDTLVLVDYITKVLPSVNEGKYLTEDELYSLINEKKPAEVDKAIRSLSGNVANRVAVLVEKEQKKVKGVQKDLEAVSKADEPAEAPEEEQAPQEEQMPEDGQQVEAPEEQPQEEGQYEEDENALPETEGDEQGQPTGGKQIHIDPDGTTAIAMPNGQVAINQDGSMDIQLLESAIDEAFDTDKYADKQASKISDKVAGKKGMLGPWLVFWFGNWIAGLIWAVIRKENDSKLDGKSAVLYSAMKHDPKCIKIINDIKAEYQKPDTDKDRMKKLKNDLKLAMKEAALLTKAGYNKTYSKQYTIAENTLVRETPRSGLLESLAVNEAMKEISEGKAYNSDACIANAIMYMTITEAMGETGLMPVNDKTYSNIITNAGGNISESKKANVVKTYKVDKQPEIVDKKEKKTTLKESYVPQNTSINESVMIQWGINNGKPKPTDLAERIRQKRLMEEQQKAAASSMLND